MQTQLDMFSPYPSGLPGYKELTTSMEAAVAISKRPCRVKRARSLIKIYLLSKTVLGGTPYEFVALHEKHPAYEHLNLNRDFIKPRFSELRALGEICKTNGRVKMETGSAAALWKLPEFCALDEVI